VVILAASMAHSSTAARIASLPLASSMCCACLGETTIWVRVVGQQRNFVLGSD
jgi:hypothetical protein